MKERAQKGKKAPRETAFHKASHKLLSNAGVIATGSLIAASFLITLLLASPALISTQLAAVVTSRLVSLTNDDRSGQGLGTLTVNPVLTAAAQAKADDMASKGYFAHVSPEGRNSWTWFQDAGYRFTNAGENLAVDFTDSGDVNKAWLNSPTHRANIMNGKFTEIGIATAEGTYEGHKTIFVVQMFGSPQASAQAQGSLTTNTLPSNPSQPALAEAQTPSSGVLGSSAEEKPKPVASVKPNVPGTTELVSPSSGDATNTDTTASSSALATTQGESTLLPPGTGGSLLATLASSPRNFLRDIYIFFALCLGVAFILRTRLEFRLHHARHAFAVVFLMVLMGGLFVTADRTVFVAPVIGSGASL